jgi:hypothetical protein
MRTIAASLSLVFGMLVLPFALPACTDAGKCTRGEVGCACTEEDECTSGTCNDGMCVAGNAAGTGGGSDVECSNDSFEEACEAFCQALCDNQEDLCEGSACADGDCGQPECELACGDDVACMAGACEAQLDMTCETFGAADSASGVFKSFCFETDPMCTVSPELGCSDTCGTMSGQVGGDLSDDGVCEDGGDGSGTNEIRCGRGTDCSDCKPRMCAVPREQCGRNGDCCGFAEDDSFCVKTGETRRECLNACSPTVACAGGEVCTPLMQGDGMVCVRR